MTGIPDHYVILGNSQIASPDEIRRAYFTVTRKQHPDRNITPGDTEFVEIQEQDLLEVTTGEYNKVSEHLMQLGNHLIARGGRQLSVTVFLEADHIHRHRSFSMEGDTKIIYGARTFLLS